MTQLESIKQNIEQIKMRLSARSVERDQLSTAIRVSKDLDRGDEKVLKEYERMQQLLEGLTGPNADASAVTHEANKNASSVRNG